MAAPTLDHIIVPMLENSPLIGCSAGCSHPEVRKAPMAGGVKGVPPEQFQNVDITVPSHPTYSIRLTAVREMQNGPGHDYANVARQVAGGENNGFVSDFALQYPDSTSTLKQDNQLLS